MKTIIAATDFSDSANNAVQFAAALASHTKCKLILFNAFQLSVHATNSLVSAAGMEAMFQSNKIDLQALGDKITFQYGINTDIYTRNAFIYDALPDAVRDTNADLVVIGMHMNNWGDRWFGNTTLSILNSATFPLLIVPEKVTYKGISKIVYAYDAKCVAAENKLLLLKEVAKCYGAQVEVFHVEKGSAEQKEEAELFLNDLKVENALTTVAHLYKGVEGGNIAEIIEQELVEYGADLLAVVPHKLPFWNRLMHRSVTRKLALEVPIPLLVLPNDKTVAFMEK